MNNQISLIFLFAILTILPVLFVLTTSFIKISVVCIMTRDSIGVQQVPPNIVLYCISLILSFYIMGPIYNNIYKNAIENNISNTTTINAVELITNINDSVQPLKLFLIKHSNPNERIFFFKNIQKYWGTDLAKEVKNNDWLVIVPAFVITEITAAFKIGFLIYLPSIIIDIVVSNILMAMGMMMMSPVTISLPIKLLLFISLDGWSRLLHALLNTY